MEYCNNVIQNFALNLGFDVISKTQKYMLFVFLFTEYIQKIFLCNELRTLKACHTQEISKFYWF